MEDCSIYEKDFDEMVSEPGTECDTESSTISDTSANKDSDSDFSEEIMDESTFNIFHCNPKFIIYALPLAFGLYASCSSGPVATTSMLGVTTLFFLKKGFCPRRRSLFPRNTTHK